MKVILRREFESLGHIGDIVEVKEGFARNFLIPRKIVYNALPGNLKALEEEKKNLDRKSKQEFQSAESMATELEKVSVTIPVQVGEEDKIFGSVTAQMISDALNEKNFEIDKKIVEDKNESEIESTIRVTNDTNVESNNLDYTEDSFDKFLSSEESDLIK